MPSSFLSLPPVVVNTDGQLIIKFSAIIIIISDAQAEGELSVKEINS